VLAVSACGGSDPGTSAAVATTSAVSAIDPTVGAAVLANTALVAESLYSSATLAAERLAGTITAFLADPTDTTLAAARDEWIVARAAYMPTEALRFSDGPIDSGLNLEGFINAWPLDEAYIDSLLAADEPIAAELLRSANERGGERNIATGWHAIEYLLWGVDDDPDGPGDRPAEDFVSSPGLAEQRRRYLEVTTEMLLDDLSAVRDTWLSGSGQFAAAYVASDSREGIQRVLTGLGTLAGGELYGQRIAVPYETKDQEEEHSCFSDNTTADHVGDVEGIRMMYLGLDAEGQPVAGTSLSALIATVDASADTSVRAAIDASLAALRSIPAPFDQAFLGPDTEPGRVAIRTAMTALTDLTSALVEAASALGLQIGTDVP
jgi:putative iron-regulated protein